MALMSSREPLLVKIHNVKHASTPWYIVVLPMTRRKPLAPVRGQASFLFSDLDRNWWEVSA